MISYLYSFLLFNTVTSPSARSGHLWQDGGCGGRHYSGFYSYFQIIVFSLSLNVTSFLPLHSYFMKREKYSILYLKFLRPQCFRLQILEYMVSEGMETKSKHQSPLIYTHLMYITKRSFNTCLEYCVLTVVGRTKSSDIILLLKFCSILDSHF